MRNAFFYGSLKIATVMKIPIKIHFSWLIVFGLLTWSLSSYYFPDDAPGLSVAYYWFIGSVAAILLFVSVALHELGHSYVARRYGIVITSITLFIFGGVASMKGEPPTPRSEFRMAIAGPITNFILAVLFFFFYSEPFSPGVKSLCLYLSKINVMLGVFNLVPGFPMDGGRILRSVLWRVQNDYFSATRKAASIGQKTALFFIFSGMFSIFLGYPGGLWMMIMGWFLYFSAHGSYQHTSLQENLSGVKVHDVMAHEIVSVTSSMTIEEVVNGYFLKYAYGGFPVYDNDKFMGIVTLKEVKHIYRKEWNDVKISEIFIPHSKKWEVSPEIDVMKAIEVMVTQNRGRLMVVQDGKVVGMVTRNGISRYMQIMEK